MSVSLARLRQLALAFPETEEHAHFGRPSFRTRKRIFATVPEDDVVVLKLPLAEQGAVIEMHPELFELGGWSHQGWTRAHLGLIEHEVLGDLLELAWSTIATKRAQKAWRELVASSR